MLALVEIPDQSPRFELFLDGNTPWYCVRTQPKHEHIAASQLREQPGIEVFLPRIRFRRTTKLGPAWVTEALFRDYLFARFDLAASLRRVQHSRSVCGVVRFGDHWPTVPHSIIAELWNAMGGQDLCVVTEGLQAGDSVEISLGALSGLQAVVKRVLPTRQRVAVLLEFLGQQTTLELDQQQLTVSRDKDLQRRRSSLLNSPVAA